MTQPLSPAAQAVLDAVASSLKGGWISPEFIPYESHKAAAALRAAADQVFPEERPPHDAMLEWIKKHPDDLPPWQIREAKRLKLLAIAAELETQP